MIRVLRPIGMDLLFSLLHLPAVGEKVLTSACTPGRAAKAPI